MKKLVDCTMCPRRAHCLNRDKEGVQKENFQCYEPSTCFDCASWFFCQNWHEKDRKATPISYDKKGGPICFVAPCNCGSCPLGDSYCKNRGLIKKPKLDTKSLKMDCFSSLHSTR